MFERLVTALLSAAFFLTASGGEIVCEAKGFAGHLQGIAADESGIYWSFYDTVVKTDYSGKELARVGIPRHAGDLCLAEGKVHVSVILYDKKMAKREGGTGWVYICDTDLKFLRKVAIPDTPRPDGITFLNGKFYIAGDDFGKAPHPVNTISVYDRDLKFERKLAVDIGKPTRHGAQTLNAVGGRILAGFYASKDNSVFLELPELKKVGTFPLSVNVGMAPVPKKLAGERELFLIARITGKKGDRGGKALVRERRGEKLVPAELQKLAGSMIHF